MSRLALIGVLALVVAACSSSGSSESSTTTSATSGTTSTLPSTTTSAPSTTTSTTLAPTTTTTLLEGNWAEVPVVTSANASTTLGWWDGTEWVQAQSRDHLPVSGGEDYQVALLGAEPVITTGGPPIHGCDIHIPSFDVPGVEVAGSLTRYLDEDPALVGSINGVAISAPWELTPRPVSETAAREELEVVAIELLADRGFETDQANLFQVVDADLDGNGSTETIVVAEDVELISGDDSGGMYSIVFVVSPSWEEPLVIVDALSVAEVNRIAAVADLNGDETMEVVINGVVVGSGWNTVYELTDSRFVDRIEAGCGV